MDIRVACMEDFEVLKKYDKHIKKDMLKSKIEDSTIIVINLEDEFIGWLRFNYFWDEHPFMNMLTILDKHRGLGYGSALTEFWESLMLDHGYKFCMVSTMSNETSQEFYRKRGYKDIGGFVLEGEPMELMMTKNLIKE